MKYFKLPDTIGVIDADDFTGFDVKACFLPYFAFSCMRGNISDIRPATGERPTAIDTFAYEDMI